LWKINNKMAGEIKQIARRLILILTGAVLLAVNIKSFVHAGGILPGGFTGLTLLIQEICWRYFDLHVPFTVINYTLNSIPAIICFRVIGKRFTLYSVLMIVVSGLLTDFMPSMFTNFLNTHDVLLSAVFGGLINAIATSLCLHADATSGGTDFLAILFSEKYRRDAWNYILAINFVILTVAGILFGIERALYSIIFQFVTTETLKVLYRNYQQRTLLIITNKPDEIFKKISELTNHGATLMECTGSYDMNKRTMLYSVVNASTVRKLITAIRKLDSEAFINVLKTEQLNGKFYQRPKD